MSMLDIFVSWDKNTKPNLSDFMTSLPLQPQLPTAGKTFPMGDLFHAWSRSRSRTGEIVAGGPTNETTKNILPPLPPTKSISLVPSQPF